jgi:Fic family protein
MDTLGSAQRLRDAGVSNEQAEAHAEAVRDFVMAELVTKSDLEGVKSDLQSVRSDLQSVKSGLQTTVQHAVQLLEAKIAAQGVQIESQTLRLTVRLGGPLAAGIGILAAILKLS